MIDHSERNKYIRDTIDGKFLRSITSNQKHAQWEKFGNNISNSKLDIINEEKVYSILCPHVDDAEFHCMSIIEKCMREGITLNIYYFTQGNRQDKRFTKVKEWYRQTYPSGNYNLIYIPLHQDGIPPVVNSFDCYITDLIYESSTHVITTAASSHQDHVYLNQLCEVSRRPRPEISALECILEYEYIQSHEFIGEMAFELDSIGVNHKLACLSAINKVDRILYPGTTMSKAYLRSQAIITGCKYGMKYAESFRVKYLKVCLS